MRIIVADDEFFARKALVKRIEELTIEIEFCKEAENGREVLELLEEERADLVVTDIRMPDMDGLEVARQLWEKFPETSVIIESGYADFDYAATAIRYGVKDYLTKPVKKEELEKAVKRVEEEQKKLRQKIEKQLAIRRGEFMDFSHILENEVTAEEILGNLFQKTAADSWYLATVQSRKQQLDKEKIQNILEIFRGEDIRAGYFCPKQEFILVLKADGGKEFPEIFFRKKLVSCWNKTGVELQVGISQCHEKTENSVKEGASAYREAVYAINQRLLQPEQQIYRYEAEVNVVQLFSQAEEIELERCLTENRTEDAINMARKLFQQCENREEISIYSLFTSLIQIMNVINKVYTIRKGQESEETDKSSYLLFNFKTDLYAFHSMEELQRYIFDLISDMSEEEGQKASIIEDLLKYLEWNYQHDITVNELAAHKYFVNPSYLSRLFKAETGKTFSKYLTELRMQKAAELLKESGLKISDVALCVGYNDVSYFIQTFKKYYLMTPEQYRNQ